MFPSYKLSQRSDVGLLWESKGIYHLKQLKDSHKRIRQFCSLNASKVFEQLKLLTFY